MTIYIKKIAFFTVKNVFFKIILDFVVKKEVFTDSGGK